MNFFEQQDQARKKTTLLVILFIAAVLFLITIANIIVLAFISVFSGSIKMSALESPGATQFNVDFSWPLFWLCAGVTITVIGIAIITKALRLRQGGHTVAELLGGHTIMTHTTDPAERRVLNVVEEMALASGMPVPTVFLLSQESGINAFAAGFQPSDAVIGVTKGCIEQLNREQLQGVIAHEFSHICNGDMRLNMKLLAVLHGIVFISQSGIIVIRSLMVKPGSRRYGSSGFFNNTRTYNRSGWWYSAIIFLLGLGLYLVGWIGSVFGNLIKAAVTRQREFLADASAVQFTRNSEGLIGALQVIASNASGSRVFDGYAPEASHLFFANVLNRANGLFSTHPPLELRIQRLRSSWHGQHDRRDANLDDKLTEKPIVSPKQMHAENVMGFSNTHLPSIDKNIANTEKGFLRSKLLLDLGIHDDSGQTLKSMQTNPEHEQLLQALILEAQDPLGASYLCYAMMLCDEPEVARKQHQFLKDNCLPAAVVKINKNYEWLQLLGFSYRLPLIELSIASLRAISLEQYNRFKEVLIFLIKADRQVSLFEWSAYQLIKYYLDKTFGLRKIRKERFNKVNDISDAFIVVLSLFVHEGHSETDLKKRAFGIGTNRMSLYNSSLIPQEHLSISTFTKAAARLSFCYPALKKRLLMALVASALSDKQITVSEKEIITSLAAVMDTPLSAQALEDLRLKA